VRQRYYHAVAHRAQSGNWALARNRAPYKGDRGGGIACEKKTHFSKKAFHVREQRRASLGENPSPAANKAVTLYDDFSYLYVAFSGELQCVDGNGNLRDRQQAKQASRPALRLGGT